jgi:hypothetical protein
MTATNSMTGTQPYTFICGACCREENSPTDNMPGGWTVIAMDCSGAPYVRCPDCGDRLQRDFDARMDDFHGLPGQGAAAAAHVEKMFRITAPKPPAFSVFLEKQDGGDFRVALLPEAVLMRWLPLGFFLTPAEARATARDLMHYAAQVERPGKLVEQGSAAA